MLGFSKCTVPWNLDIILLNILQKGTVKSTGETPSTFSQLLWCLQLCLTFYSDYVALLLLFRTSSSIIVLGHHVFPIVIRFYVVMLLLFMIKKMAHVYICCYVPECGSFLL